MQKQDTPSNYDLQVDLARQIFLDYDQAPALADCYSETFVEQAQESADLIGCAPDYTIGSNRLLEKLLSRQWDEQFLVAEPGHTIAHKDFFA